MAKFFFTIPLPNHVGLIEAQQYLRSKLPEGATFVDPGDFHMTLLFIEDADRYSASMASVGQTSTHEPQSVQISALIEDISSPSVIASSGHSSIQAPQLIHSSVIL